MQEEAKRDFGVSLSQKQIQAFTDSMGISEEKAWGIRGKLMLSPQFQNYMLYLGKNPHASKYYPDLQDELDAGKKGDWSAYDAWFKDQYGTKEKGTLSKIPDWYDKLSMPNAKAKPLGVFHAGTPFVPETGVYELEKGEAVIRKEENTGARNITVRGGNYTIAPVFSGNNVADMKRTFKEEFLPLLKDAIRRGNDDIGEVITKRVMRTKSAFNPVGAF
jgi:hypothetical protein